jgi:hypothetical protein
MHELSLAPRYDSVATPKPLLDLKDFLGAQESLHWRVPL